MMKILDLRNASKQGIEVVNRQRIIEAFGKRRVVGDDGEVGFVGEPQSGGSEVQGTPPPSSLPLPVSVYVADVDRIVNTWKMMAMN